MYDLWRNAAGRFWYHIWDNYTRGGSRTFFCRQDDCPRVELKGRIYNNLCQQCWNAVHRPARTGGPQGERVDNGIVGLVDGNGCAKAIATLVEHHVSAVMDYLVVVRNIAICTC